MADKAQLKFKRNESFHIREGWFEKAMMAINDVNGQGNVFSKQDGVKNLGIGSNMVSGLRYWLLAAGIITGKVGVSEFTEFGKVLYAHDPFLESRFSWFMIHYMLATNLTDNPVAYEIFNDNNRALEKTAAVAMLEEKLMAIDKKIKPAYIDADFGVFLRSYVAEDTISNPEDNSVCPLSALKLMKKHGTGYEKTNPVYSSLSYLAVYYVLTVLYAEERSFIIEDSMTAVNSPARIFNLDQYMYLQYLEEMRKAGLVTITKTAGLNTVTFEEKLGISEVFDRWEALHDNEIQ